MSQTTTDTVARPRRAQRAPAAEPAPVAEAPASARSDEFGALGPVSTEKVRKPLGSHRRKLDNTQREGFHRHWFNDDDKGRIKDAEDAGYAHVKGPDGKPMSRVVGTKQTGGPLVAYYMEIPLHFWQQDQDEKVAARRQRQAEMQRGVTGKGGPGDDGRYLPVDGANQALSRIQHGGK
jgi:hypothetical protein